MATMYCALCRRPVEARRHIGAGTVLLAIFTAGFGLLLIPFYARRCCICRSAAVSVNPPQASVPEPAVASPLMRLAALEQRLSLTERELEAATAGFDQISTERDFYRQLLGDRAPAADSRFRSQ